MELINLEQGTQEWLDERLKHYTASDAPVVMNESKYKTRTKLLDEKKGAATEVITPAKQALFNKGHKAEDDQRSVLELETMDSYAPCVGIASYFPNDKPDCLPLPLMASFDGRSDMEDHLFEHKLWNETLAENVRNKVLEPSHYWQLEHQLIVDEKAEYVLFVVSDGTAAKREMMKYYRVAGRREELIAAWALFMDDLEGHELKAKQELVVADVNSFPIFKWDVKGTEITSNIKDYLKEIKELAEIEMNKDFKTDQDFANKDQLNKEVKKARANLKEAVGKIKGKFVSYSDFETIAQDMDDVLQKMQSHGEKQVKKAKEAKKQAIEEKATLEIVNFSTECDKKIAPMHLSNIISFGMPDFDKAMKGKRTIESLVNAVEGEVATAKLEINKVMDLVVPNLQYLRDNAEEYKFLFKDASSLVNQSIESFNAIVTTRIDEHKKVEKKKAEDAAALIVEQQAAVIRKEERERIEAEQNKLSDHLAAILLNDQFDQDKEFEKAQEAATLAKQPSHDLEPEINHNNFVPYRTMEGVAVNDHPSDCKGCPDCQSSSPLSDAITNEAMGEELGDTEEITLSSVSHEKHGDVKIMNFYFSNGQSAGFEVCKNDSKSKLVSTLFGLADIIAQTIK